MSDIVFKKIQPKSVIERDNDINANFQAIGKEIYKRAFVGIIGDGISKEITVTHNLNTNGIIIDLWSNIAPYKNMLKNAEIVDDNNIKFTFDVAPLIDSLKVIVTSISTAYASPIFEARVKALEDEMPFKANLVYVDGKLVKKADLDYVNNKLALKTDKSYTNTELRKKADKSVTDDLSLNKADKSDTYTRAELYNQTEINNFLDKKADKSNTYTRSELDHHVGNIEQKANNNASEISNLNNRTGALEQSVSSNNQQINNNNQQIANNAQSITNNKGFIDENKSEILKHDLALKSNTKDLLTNKDLINSNANNILRKADKSDTYTKGEVNTELANKADILQEDWIEPTLLNGWTGIVKYRKNQFGVVEVYIALDANSGANGTIAFNLPSKYLSTFEIRNALATNSVNDGAYAIFFGGTCVIYKSNLSDKVGGTCLIFPSM